MAPQPPPSPPGPPADLAEQARLHLESLRAAGVEWLGPPDPAAHPSHSPHVEAGQEPGVAADPPPAPPDPPAAGPPGTLFGEPDIAAASPALSPEQRRQELAVLAETVSGCRRCPALAATRTQTVFGVGPPDAELCFVGEAPGADEDRQGEPFVGAAGQLLNRIIAACGMRREEVYICNILRCR
ncbi:MAG TPA: uracil-DNA glycosylase, partial [Gemmataceae bacterium]